jgi:tRNA U34 5-methylaminomethyl-2-thiouridine-forming methyltransferase MnmC
MLSRKIIPTEDGSSTIYIPEWNESYHSKHGAIQEAYHVFIQNGLNDFSDKSEISILEIGFGTGLNSLITLNESLKRNLNIQYTGIEKYPVSEQETLSLHYAKSLKEFNPDMKRSLEELEDDYSKLMKAPWEEFSSIYSNFELRKIQADFLDFNYPKEEFDLVYFDAFGARVQPELWTEELLGKIYLSMKKGGLFTTYSAKGSVRRALIAVGMEVEKRPGPPGKREMLVARKP